MQELGTRSRLLHTHSKLSQNLWAASMNHDNWLGNRLPSSCIEGQWPYLYEASINYIITGNSQVLTPRICLQIRFPHNSQQEVFCKVHLCSILGIQSDDWLFRLYFSATHAICIVRLLYFKPIMCERLPGVAAIISIDKFSKSNDSQVEKDFLQTFRALTEISTCTSPIGQHWNQPVSKSFTKVVKGLRSCEEIEKEYRALVKRQIRTFVPRTHSMNVLPITWVFQLKPNEKKNFKYLFQAKCNVRGDAYFDFNPEILYALGARHKSIWLLFMVAAFNWIFIERVRTCMETVITTYPFNNQQILPKHNLIQEWYVNFIYQCMSSNRAFDYRAKFSLTL